MVWGTETVAPVSNDKLVDIDNKAQVLEILEEQMLTMQEDLVKDFGLVKGGHGKEIATVRESNKDDVALALGIVGTLFGILSMLGLAYLLTRELRRPSEDKVTNNYVNLKE